MKNSKILAAPLLIIVVLICAVSVEAYMRKQTDVVENVFIPAEVSCEVDETFKSDNQKTDISIKNTGTIDAYLRLRLVTYWVNGDGDILFKESSTLSVDYDKVNWIESGDTYYYKYPVPAGESTVDLLDSSISLSTNDGKRQVIEVFADAIQSKPAEAVTSAWSVSVDQNGVITSVN